MAASRLADDASPQSCALFVRSPRSASGWVLRRIAWARSVRWRSPISPSAASPTCTSSSSSARTAFYECVAGDVRRLGPWQGQRRGSVTALKPEHRLALAREGYALVRCSTRRRDPRFRCFGLGYTELIVDADGAPPERVSACSRIECNGSPRRARPDTKEVIMRYFAALAILILATTTALATGKGAGAKGGPA